MKFFVKSQAPDRHAGVTEHTPDRHSDDSRLHTGLQDLIALRALAHGFALNPADPIKNQFIGRHDSRHRGRGLNFEELAHYQHGDDIRTMDWKVTNRTGKPHVRVFTEERERPVMLACDQRTNMLFGSQHKLKSVVASEVLALLAWRQLALNDAVATLVFNDDLIAESRPHRSQRMLLKDLRTLAELNHSLLGKAQAIAAKRATPIGLSNVLDRLLRLCPRNCLIVLISDFNDLDHNSNQQIKSLALNNDVFAALISDPLEHELPDNKQFVASNGAEQLAVNTSDTAFTQGFNQYQLQRMTQIRLQLKNAGVTLIDVDTVEDSHKQLRRCIADNNVQKEKRQLARHLNNG